MYNEVSHNIWLTVPPSGAKCKLQHYANSENPSTFKKVNSSLINLPQADNKNWTESIIFYQYRFY